MVPARVIGVGFKVVDLGVDVPIRTFIGAAGGAIRKPRAYAVEKPGDLAHVDTMDVPSLPGVAFMDRTAWERVYNTT